MLHVFLDCLESDTILANTSCVGQPISTSAGSGGAAATSTAVRCVLIPLVYDFSEQWPPPSSGGSSSSKPASTGSATSTPKPSTAAAPSNYANAGVATLIGAALLSLVL